MINAWEKLACLNAVVNFVNKTSLDAKDGENDVSPKSLICFF